MPNKTLDSLPKKEKSTAIGFIRSNLDSIIRAQKKGHTYADLYRELTQTSEVKCTEGTFKRTVQKVKNEERKLPQLNVLPMPQKR